VSRTRKVMRRGSRSNPMIERYIDDLPRAVSPINSPVLLTEAETGKYMHIAPATLTKWRCTKQYNLKYIKIGNRIMYSLDDIKEFLRSRTRGGEAA
jgi:hypothetical protein